MKSILFFCVFLVITGCGDKSASEVASDEIKAAAFEQQVRGFVFSD